MRSFGNQRIKTNRYPRLTPTQSIPNRFNNGYDDLELNQELSPNIEDALTQSINDTDKKGD